MLSSCREAPLVQMAIVIWTKSALAQLDSILDFIALDKPDAAQGVAAQVFDAINHLERFVRLGRPIQEFPHKNYRQVLDQALLALLQAR